MESDFVKAKLTISTAGLDVLSWAKRKARLLGSIMAESRDADRLDRPSVLDETTRNELESFLGHNLKDARIHENRQAGDMARRLGAEAFTVGSDIYAAEAKLSGATRESKGLLVHELVHVVQQTSPMHIAGGPEDKTLGTAGRSRFDVPAEVPGCAEFTDLPVTQFALSNTQLKEGGSQNPHEEAAAQAAEQDIVQSGITPAKEQALAIVYAYEVADRVYLLMQRDLLTDKDRAGR